MPENISDLEALISEATTAQFREKLLSKGEARSMIWDDGELPESAPKFHALLSYDLLSYGYALLSLGLRLVEVDGSKQIARQAFENAATSIESVLTRKSGSDDQSFHRVVAAASYQLGNFAARSYSLLNIEELSSSVTVGELSLVYLLRRDIESLDTLIQEFNEADEAEDSKLSMLLETHRVSSEDDLEGDVILEAVDLVLTENFVGALSRALLAFQRGEHVLLSDAVQLLRQGLRAAEKSNLVRQWWIHRLTIHLLDELWGMSLHRILPIDPVDNGNSRWNRLRKVYIATLFKRKRSEIDLWPSQIEAARHSMDASRNLVLSLPTSAGKTRIAEICILAALAKSERVIFITPLRALSSQTESSLRNTFEPLGMSVSSLYGPAGVIGFDSNVLQEADIVVATPEKFDFAFRENPNLLDDVGLVVLDEGHMIGPNEREVRYEVLLQRMMNRGDADSRRIVCLSAILPTGESVQDFAGWLTRDQDEGLISSRWRPTRLRFGEVIWQDTHARLNIFLDGVETFIPRFFEAVELHTGRRKKPFPKNQQELTIATSWKLVEGGKSVLIYCPQKTSVNSLAKKVVELAEQGYIGDMFAPDPERIAAAIARGEEWLPNGHPILECLKLGVAVHHGSLPGPFRSELEELLRSGVLKVTISSPTLAQGLNLSASALVVHSLWRNKEMIDTPEFQNIVGRAGRAFVDSVGLIVHPIFPENPKKLAIKRRNWKKLINHDGLRDMESGILRLVVQLIDQMIKKYNPSNPDELVDYVAGITAWDELENSNSLAQGSDDSGNQLDLQLASLDCAILGLLGDYPVEEENLEAVLDQVLASSLWSRTIARREVRMQKLLNNGLRSRAHLIWRQTTSEQRRGYFLAGVGLRTGQKLDEYAFVLEAHMRQADQAIQVGDGETAIDALVEFARIIFEISPFTPKKLPDSWEAILADWLNGLSITHLYDADSTEVVDFIEEALVYRLSWALEAVRARARAHADSLIEPWGFSEEERGSAAIAIQTGTLSRTASLLVQLGFSSRIGAVAAATELGDSIVDQNQLYLRLQSSELQERLNEQSWPTAESHQLWVDFVRSFEVGLARSWSETSLVVPVEWETDFEPDVGTPFRARTSEVGITTLELSNGRQVGTVGFSMNPTRKGVLVATSSDTQGTVDVVYIGPDDLF